MKKGRMKKLSFFHMPFFSCRHSVIIIETFRMPAQRDNHETFRMPAQRDNR